MITSRNKPKIYNRLRKKFNISWNDGIIITYEGVVYCKYSIKKAKIVHESVHLRQQAEDPDWWDKYIDDKDFRLQQELEAYKIEMKHIDIIMGHQPFIKAHMLNKIAKDLSSHVYGNILTFKEAKELLKI